jgi:hypothetical protein
MLYRFTERDGRKGPPAENKARCNRTNTPHSKAVMLYRPRVCAIGCSAGWPSCAVVNRPTARRHPRLQIRCVAAFMNGQSVIS